MHYNYNSGFSLPLYSHSIFLANKTTKPLNSNKYLSLLVDVYSNYDSYDDLLFPLNVFLRKSFNLDKHDFRRHYVFSANGKSLKLHNPTSIEKRAESFFVKLFVWQRWKLEQQLHDNKIFKKDWN
jgi:hypothetical protein